MNYLIKIWESSEARNEGIALTLNPSNGEVTTPFLPFIESKTIQTEQIMNSIEEMTEWVTKMYNDIYTLTGGSIEIVKGDNTLYHISEDSNNELKGIEK